MLPTLSSRGPSLCALEGDTGAPVGFPGLWGLGPSACWGTKYTDVETETWATEESGIE